MRGGVLLLWVCHCDQSTPSQHGLHSGLECWDCTPGPTSLACNTNVACCLLVRSPLVTSLITPDRLSAGLAKAELCIENMIITA